MIRSLDRLAMTLHAALLLLVLGVAAAPAPAADSRDPDTHFFNQNTGDLKAELADARAARKTAILIMYEQEGCPSCFYMRTQVLNRPDVQQFYRERFVNFTIDVFGSVPVTGFNGANYTEKSFAQTQNIVGTPTFVFHDLDGKEITRIVGRVREVTEFLLLGEYIASGAYRTRNFAEYKQEAQLRKGS